MISDTMCEGKNGYFFSVNGVHARAHVLDKNGYVFPASTSFDPHFFNETTNLPSTCGSNLHLQAHLLTSNILCYQH